MAPGNGDSNQCVLVGEARADIAGIGILVGFIGQALLSLSLAMWVFFLSKNGSLELHHDEGTVEHEIEHKRLESVSDILMIGSNIQMVLGVSYIINIFAWGRQMDTYHLRLAFDIVCFVGVSNAAAMVCWTYCETKIKSRHAKWHANASTKEKWRAYFELRHRSTYLFIAMFLALTVALLVRLGDWSVDTEPGRCYVSHGVTRTNSDHPTDDMTYVAITAVYMVLVQICSVFAPARYRRPILSCAFLQFPVHLYMALSLRQSNQGHLTGCETNENAWDFGQTTAVVLLGGAIFELVEKGVEYFKFEHKLRHTGHVPTGHHHHDPDQEHDLFHQQHHPSVGSQSYKSTQFDTEEGRLMTSHTTSNAP